jgi:hypothetical protein
MAAKLSPTMRTLLRDINRATFKGSQFDPVDVHSLPILYGTSRSRTLKALESRGLIEQRGALGGPTVSLTTAGVELLRKEAGLTNTGKPIRFQVFRTDGPTINFGVDEIAERDSMVSSLKKRGVYESTWDTHSNPVSDKFAELFKG